MHLVLSALILSFVVSCAARGAIAGGDQVPNTGGTISGIVRANADTPLAGRKVTVTNVDNGQALETVTAANGGYTIKVPRGNYRIEVELRPGESLSQKPEDVHITISDIDAGRNFVITMKL